LRKFKPPNQDLLATVLVFKLHIFSLDSVLSLDSHQSEKVRNTQIVNITATTIWVRFTWHVLLVCVRFLQPWWATCNVVLTLWFKVFMPPHMLYTVGANAVIVGTPVMI